MFKFKNPYNSFFLQFFKVHFHVIIEKMYILSKYQLLI